MDNTNNNHLSEPHDSSETPNKDRVYNIVSIAVTVVILAAAAVFVIALFSTANKEPEALFNENSVEFTGLYGMKYLLSDVKSLNLKDTIAVGDNLYGASIGDVKKGDWAVEGMGRCRLFVMSGNGPFVVIETKKSGYVIINYRDAAKTKSLYEDLLAWKKQ